MTPVQKYRALLFIVLTAGFYLLLTEVWDRWAQAFQEWASLSEKSTRVMTPEEALLKKADLRRELDTLRTSIIRNSQGADQSVAGLLELVDIAAKREAIGVETLTPLKQEGNGGLSVSLDLLGSFHRIGAFLNCLENAPIAMKLEKLEIKRSTGHILYAKIVLKASFLKTSGQK